MSKLRAWLYAFRLRTLPLAFSSIVTGTFIAFSFYKQSFSWLVFFLCLSTTLLLQILSNLANDYGDSEKGTDNENRIGPKRAVQSGLLSFSEIKMGIIITTAICLVSGILLIWVSLGSTVSVSGLLFFFFGLAAIAAAIKYTIGKGAYGYHGLGDLFVLIFFGFVGVMGSFYLQTRYFDFTVLLPAASIGLLSAGVLNLNNMRDMESDTLASKNTLVVKIGLQRARQYHTTLIVLAFLFATIFVLVRSSSTMAFLFIITIPLFRRHLVAVRQVEALVDFDPLLKQLALATFMFAILFSIGIVVGEV